MTQLYLGGFRQVLLDNIVAVPNFGSMQGALLTLADRFNGHIHLLRRERQ